jgi:hypothetical protein
MKKTENKDRLLPKRMTRKDAIEYINKQLPSYLEQIGLSADGNIECLNDEHRDRSYSMRYDAERNGVCCSQCGAHYSIFELLTREENYDGQHSMGWLALPKALEMYNITLVDEQEPLSTATMVPETQTTVKDK